MIKSGTTPRLSFIGAKTQFLACLIIAVMFTVAATPPPDQQLPDEQYIQIMNLIDRADALQKAGQVDAAKEKYRDAQKALIWFKAANPLFAPKTVAYRINEVTARVDARPAVIETNTPSSSKPKLEAETTKVEVKLLEAGTEPRTALRIHPTPGDKQTVTMTTKVTMDMGGATPAAGAAAIPAVKIPAITIPMDVSIQAISTNGDISFESVLGEATIAEEAGTLPQVVQGLKTALAGIKGVTITGINSSRGLTKKVDVKGPATADPQVKQMIDQIKNGLSNPGVPFPEEAVGTGAKWEVKIPTKAQGLALDQTATYQLTSVEGDHVKATFSMNINAANTKNAATSMGTANGTVDMDLSKFVALGTTVDTQMDIAPSKQQPVAMKMSMNVTMDSK